MNKEEAELLSYNIDDEGFDYAMKYKSSWKEIKDEEFHRLRNEYLDAMDKLAKYIEDSK